MSEQYPTCIMQANHQESTWMKGDCRIFCCLELLSLDLWTVLPLLWSAVFWGSVTCFGLSSVLCYLPPTLTFCSVSLLSVYISSLVAKLPVLSASVLLLSVSDQAFLPTALLSPASIAPFTKFRKGRTQDLQTGPVKPSLLDGCGKLKVLKVRGCHILM